MILEHLYPAIRPLLFQLDAERAHHFTIRALKMMQKVPFFSSAPVERNPVTKMGLEFPNRIGLAAGLDKNAEAVVGLGGSGFGFIEVGTLTPRPQEGNPRPRLFRLKEQQALINRMGFNNCGILAAVETLKQTSWQGVLGVNIGKNKTTANEDALADYLYGLEHSAEVADYWTINLSSPNTPQLRALLEPVALKNLLQPLLQRREELAHKLQKPLPLLVKVTPDSDAAQLREIAAVMNELRPQGVIATNTTVSRQEISSHPLSVESGGVSGAPLQEKALRTLEQLRAQLDPEICLVASGGIMNAAEAQTRLACGADLVQLYTGFVYHGPKLVRQCIQAC